MKVVRSLRSARKRHPACKVVKRRGVIYVINKVDPRFKSKQMARRKKRLKSSRTRRRPARA